MKNTINFPERPANLPVDNHPGAGGYTVGSSWCRNCGKKVLYHDACAGEGNDTSGCRSCAPAKWGPLAQ